MFFSDQKSDEKEGDQGLALLPLRDLVVFPHMVVPLIVVMMARVVLEQWQR